MNDPSYFVHQCCSPCSSCRCRRRCLFSIRSRGVDIPVTGSDEFKRGGSSPSGVVVCPSPRSVWGVLSVVARHRRRSVVVVMVSGCVAVGARVTLFGASGERSGGGGCWGCWDGAAMLGVVSVLERTVVLQTVDGGLGRKCSPCPPSKGALLLWCQVRMSSKLGLVVTICCCVTIV